MAHAFLSPSGAPGWLRCNLKPWLESGIPDSSSSAADEGTAAHSVAADCLIKGLAPSSFLGKAVQIADNDFWVVDEDMVEHVQTYIDNIRAIPGELMVEQPLRIGFITGEDDATGTGDAVIINEPVLEIHDLKYGYSYVPADSEQLLMYASAAVRQFSTVADIERVVCAIHQPRIGSFPRFEISVEDLLAWEKGARETAERIMAGPEGLVATPGEKQCKFCRAKGSCPALAEKALSIVRLDDFSDLDAKIALLTNDELADIAHKLDMIHDWCNGVRAEMDRRILAGQEVRGWKVVAGKKGNRAWSDEAVVGALLESHLGQKAYTKKVITPTQAEKLLKDQFKQFQNFVTQADGKPAVVQITDKRPAISVSCDFQPIEE